jgi:hypothetical protein
MVFWGQFFCTFQPTKKCFQYIQTIFVLKYNPNSLDHLDSLGRFFNFLKPWPKMGSYQLENC